MGEKIMTLFYVIFAVAAGLLLLSHVAAVFLGGVPGRIAGYIGTVLSAVMFLSVSYIWRSLEISLASVFASLFIYLLISLIRIAIIRRKADKKEGEV